MITWNQSKEVAYWACGWRQFSCLQFLAVDQLLLPKYLLTYKTTSLPTYLKVPTLHLSGGLEQETYSSPGVQYMYYYTYCESAYFVPALRSCLLAVPIRSTGVHIKRIPIIHATSYVHVCSIDLTT